MNSYIKIMQQRNKNKQKVISEKEFLDAEKREKTLEQLENEHEDTKNSN